MWDKCLHYTKITKKKKKTYYIITYILSDFIE